VPYLCGGQDEGGSVGCVLPTTVVIQPARSNSVCEIFEVLISDTGHDTSHVLCLACNLIKRQAWERRPRKGISVRICHKDPYSLFCHRCPNLQVVETRSTAVRAAADEFTRFLFTTPAQREFAKLGFRVNPKVSKQAADSQVTE
jgi:hypothetical protein